MHAFKFTTGNTWNYILPEQPHSRVRRCIVVYALFLLDNDLYILNMGIF